MRNNIHLRDHGGMKPPNVRIDITFSAIQMKDCIVFPSLCPKSKLFLKGFFMTIVIVV
jgi:hypothetical protein